MRQINKEELKLILDNHTLWIQDNNKGQRADLSEANLSEANLSRANLSWANLSGANLSWANLSWANLSGANLSWANLSGANLSWANLSRATNLSWANLSEANLSGADLSGAYLSGANLSWAKLPNFSIVPQEGDFIAYKKLKNCVAKLLIPANAKRTSSLVGRKCRAEFVRVLELGPNMLEDFDSHSGKVRYSVGEVIRPDLYNDDIKIECTNGIHFFITRKEAEEYS